MTIILKPQKRHEIVLNVSVKLGKENAKTYILQGVSLTGSLSKPRRRRERERHQTKGLMSKTKAVHVRYTSLYISLPSSAKLEREMTNVCVVYRTWTTMANFSYFHLELNAIVAYLA